MLTFGFPFGPTGYALNVILTVSKLSISRKEKLPEDTKHMCVAYSFLFVQDVFIVFCVIIRSLFDTTSLKLDVDGPLFVNSFSRDRDFIVAFVSEKATAMFLDGFSRCK